MPCYYHTCPNWSFLGIIIPIIFYNVCPTTMYLVLTYQTQGYNNKEHEKEYLENET